MEKVYGIIYKTTNLINGKIYIGQTVRLDKKSYIGSGSLISAAIKKYGKENFIRETLKECYNQFELDEWEDLLIWEYNSRDRNIGYNIAAGSVLAIGEMSHTKLPEVRLKMSEAHKNISEETRAKISAAGKGNKNMLGKTHSEESRARMSEAHKGRTHSEESRAKISAAGKGRTPSEGTRAKLSAARKNISEETRAKLSAANKGRNNPNYGKKIPEETRAKKSIPILQYDKQGNFITEYYGASEAERQTGIGNGSINRCCKGKLKSAGGYIWKYKSDNSEVIEYKIHSEETRMKRSKPVLQYDKQGNFIAEYYGAMEAGRQTGIPNQSISKCCKGKRKSASGYIWKYK